MQESNAGPDKIETSEAPMNKRGIRKPNMKKKEVKEDPID